MGKNIAEKIFESHKAYGDLKPDTPVGLNDDQVYTQDATGTMTWLQFEAIGIDRVKVPLAVSYVDHNMLQQNYMNPDDHLFLQTVAAKYGAYFSRPGNGICHQVHLEQFAAPGRIALGTDSHTPTGGDLSGESWAPRSSLRAQGFLRFLRGGAGFRLTRSDLGLRA